MRSPTFAKFSTGYIYSLWETKKLCSNIWIWEWNMSDCRMAQSAMLVFSEWVICRAVNGASRNSVWSAKILKPNHRYIGKDFYGQDKCLKSNVYLLCLKACLEHRVVWFWTVKAAAGFQQWQGPIKGNVKFCEVPLTALTCRGWLPGILAGWAAVSCDLPSSLHWLEESVTRVPSLSHAGGGIVLYLSSPATC